MKRKSFLLIISSIILLCLPRIASAAHPLISDDSGTQGKGKWQLEIMGEYDFDKTNSIGPAGTETSTKDRNAELRNVLTYGISDPVDLVLSVPYQWKRSDTDGNVTSSKGFSDITLEVKWRFFEKDGLGIAVKPGVILPTGDKDEDLGAGRTGFTLFLLATKELPLWAFNFNLGYKRNENRIDERVDIWHVSASAEYKVRKEFRLVANIGAERNTDLDSKTAPAFALAGFIYSVAENCDFDMGVKYGLNYPETDLALLMGLTFRF